MRTFGYRKAPVVGALINLTTLIIIGLYLIYQSVIRFFEQPEVGGFIIVIVAGITLAEMEKLKGRIKSLLRVEFRIDHATLEFEIREADELDRHLVVG